MSDRETVITHLQIIHTWASFARERDLQFFTGKHLEDIAQWTVDALALLKEQEVIPHKNYANLDLWWCGCGWCLGMGKTFNYCPKCGKAVKWE